MIGVLSVALAIWAQSFVAGHEFPYDGLLLYAVALILAARAFEFPPKGSANGRTAAPVVDGTRRWTVDRSVAPVGAFALAANLLALRLFAANSNPSAAWVLYAGSVVATPVAVWLASGRRRPRPLRDWDLTEAAALGVVLLVAAAFRLFRIDSLPFGLWWDEASYGLQVLHIMNDPSYRPVFVGGASQMPALMWYVMIPFFAAFGPTPLGLRIASATAGVLGVLAVYLLSRELFGKRTGFVAGLLLAVMAWHVNWSRIGMAGVWSVALDAPVGSLPDPGAAHRQLAQLRPGRDRARPGAEHVLLVAPDAPGAGPLRRPPGPGGASQLLQETAGWAGGLLCNVSDHGEPTG